MIEIVQRKETDAELLNSACIEEKAEHLPRNFRQIGTPDAAKRIYIEDYVYTYLHPAFSSADEQRICILTGEIKQTAGCTCIYVKGAIELQGVTYCGNTPILSEATRAEICMQIKKFFDGSALLGWFYDEKGIPPKLTPEIERVHKRFFGGNNRILLLSDSLEKEETLYIYEDSAIHKKEGYYIYYERNINMQEYMISKRVENHEEIKPEEVRDEALKSYREMVLNRNTSKGNKWNSVLYATGMLLVIVISVIGITMFNNYQKMKSIEAAVSVMSQSYEQATDTETTHVLIEEVKGNVSPKEDTPQSQPQDEQAPAAEAPQPDTPQPQIPQGETAQDESAQADPVQTEQLSEAQQILQQGYYVVQPGESMTAICRKIYQDSGKVDAVCAANGITDVDKVKAGQKLVLPQ